MDKRQKTVIDYKEKSDSNYKLYEFLSENSKFNDWQIVALFYSALCYMKAYLYSKTGICLDSINSHDSVKDLISKETTLKRLGIIIPYEELYREARTARYTSKTFKENRINKAKCNLNQIKALVKI